MDSFLLEAMREVDRLTPGSPRLLCSDAPSIGTVGMRAAELGFYFLDETQEFRHPDGSTFHRDRPDMKRLRWYESVPSQVAAADWRIKLG